MSDTTIIIAATEKLFKQLEIRVSRIEDIMNRSFHGNTGYSLGCRCEICREARKLSMREYRANKNRSE